MPKYFKHLNFLIKSTKIVFSLETHKTRLNIHWQIKEGSSELIFKIVRFSDHY